MDVQARCRAASAVGLGQFRIVNSPVRISTPSAIITAPPIPMIDREVALDDRRARSSPARTRARSAGTGSPGQPSRRRAAAPPCAAELGDRRLGEDRAEGDARARRPRDRERRPGDQRTAAPGEAQQRLRVPLAVEPMPTNGVARNTTPIATITTPPTCSSVCLWSFSAEPIAVALEPEQDEDRARSWR